MQIIPAIDLLGDDVVRLERGDYDRVIFRCPLEEFVPRVVANRPPLVHVVDLEGARQGALRTAVIERCASLLGNIPIQVSGGLRSVSQAQDALSAGASRVIVGTAAWATPGALSEFVDALGDHLLIALDVKNGEILSKGWLASAGISFEDALERCDTAGVTRIHVTAIERDGTMAGPDFALYQRACQSSIKVVAAGGVRNDDDVEQLSRVGCEAAVMGLGYLNKLGFSVGDSSTFPTTK